ncbi:MAG: lysophospholipid acyltransferase family protein [Gemmatimonas sp.]
MKLYRRILQQPPVRRAVAALIAGYIRLVHATSRWHTVRGDIPERLRTEGKSFIVCFWHGRLLMMNLAWRSDVPFYMLSSPHADGRLTTAVMGHFNIDTVTGSTRKGGTAALRQLARLLRGGACAGITPDGPRGPRMRASMGAIVLARMSGVPLVPATYSATPRKVIGSWDRFILPSPFGRGVFVWGEPIAVPSDGDPASMEAQRLLLEQRMNALADEADRIMGVAPIAPAPAPVEPESVT